MAIVLTNNAKFRPYSFDEMLKPLAMATQEQRAIEEGIAELGTKADLMRMYANEQPDSKVANMYNTYANDLDKQAESLAKNGLNPTSRSSLLGLKRRYSTEITPIETAVTRRRQLAEEQRKALLQNPTLMFERNFNTLSNATSLDRFIENPEYDYGARYSGAQITSDVSNMAKNISKELRNYYVGNNVDDYTKTLIKQYGLSSADIKKFIDNPNSEEANKVLFAIYNSALSTVPEAIRNNYSEEVAQYASKGLWDAVGTNQVSTFDDYGAKLKEQSRRSSAGRAKEESIDLQTRALSFPKDRQLIDSYLDKDGKIKDTNILFQDGIFKGPKEPSASSSAMSHALYEVDKDKYNKLVTIFKDRGFTDEQINNMTQEQVEQNLKNIKELNTNDVFVKNAIQLHLSADATKNTIETLRALNIVPEEIEGFTLDKDAKDSNGKVIKGKGQYKTKALDSLDDLEYEDGWQAFQLYDKQNNQPILLINGKYYKIPLSLYSNEVQRRLTEFTSPQDETMQIAERNLVDLVSQGKTWRELGFESEEQFTKALNTAVYNIKERTKFWSDFQREPLRMAGTKNTTN